MLQLTPLRFATDEDIDEDVVTYLRQRGHDVVRVRDRFGERTVDRSNMQWSRAENRILVTGDHKFAQPQRTNPKRSAILVLWDIDALQAARVAALIAVIEQEAHLRPTIFYMCIQRDRFDVQR